MIRPQHLRQGFTIVELLIVIVVIAILAAITIVAYNGIQNRANDTAIQSDLKNIAKLFEIYKTEKGSYPYNSYDNSVTQLNTLGIRATKQAYGPGFDSKHNLLYCRVADASPPLEYALMAESKSGKVFIYKSSTGAIANIPGWVSTGSNTNCQNAGINQTVGTDRDIMYYNSSWMPYVAG